ncbi:hypothetical protein FRC03_007906 [Tulasnella sp. 419]|nr:hypothetical protein FRC03_007906 [Tulasnella sp. 419]
MEQLENLNASDYRSWLAEEAVYLAGLNKEPEQDTLAIAYVEALDELTAAEKAYEASWKDLVLPSSQDTTTELSKCPIKLSFKAAMQKITTCQTNVADLEGQLRINVRWTPESPEYIATKKYIRERKYRRALDSLEKLVVQRLFELQKGHLASTGYKLRTHIAKHLKSRSEAIRTALKAFNAAARSLNPKHMKIEFTDIVKWSFCHEPVTCYMRS